MLFIIISARAEKHKLEGPRLDNFIQEKMRGIITGEKTNSAGELEFNCHWIHDGKELCRKSYAFLFKIPRNKFDQCSRVFKETGRKFITSISHEKWEDDHVHDFTFAQTEEIVKENIGGMVIVGNESSIINKNI
jgi:hypothetical protein